MLFCCHIFPEILAQDGQTAEIWNLEETKSMEI